ncbi:MAG: ABC transporter substrate-binding protein [Candidatus Methanoperedens sp.]|nr:ABC transporter substrate-binding protein [Candidatus Methanoperedens sp.]CAG1000123.1 Leucine-, isoleucine-, valine-, threonine-, and alanine-binding protein [Methanosarcinales archaeon]
MQKWFVVGMLIAIVIAGGCVNKEDGTNKTVPQTKLEDIKIGVLITQTGGLGPIGEGMANGAKLAALEINKQGINGRNVTLIIEDTGTNPAKAAEAAKKLIEMDKVQVIIGAVASSETLAVAPIVEKSKVVLISPSSTAPSVTDAGEYVFRVIGSDNLQGDAISQLAMAENFTKPATLVENNDYGIGLENVFKTKFKGTVVSSIHYEKGKADYRTELDTIKKANPDVIIFVGYPAEASTILAQTKQLGLKTKWIAAEGIADPVMFDNKDVAAQMEGMYLTRPASPEGNPEYQNFQKLYREAFGKDPGIYSDTEFDATMLAAEVIKEVGNDGEKIKNALPPVSRQYKAITGDKVFDENGDVPQDYTVLEVKNKTMVTIGSWSLNSGIKLQ